MNMNLSVHIDADKDSDTDMKSTNPWISVPLCVCVWVHLPIDQCAVSPNLT